MKEFWQDAKPAATDSVSYHYTPSMEAKSAYFYVQDIGHFRCGYDYYTKRAGYESILLIYTVAGSGLARYRNREYVLKPGQALLMNCYEYQEYQTGKEGFWEIKWVHFSGSTSEEYFNIIYNRHGGLIDLGNENGLLPLLEGMLSLAEKSSYLPEARVSLMIAGILTQLLLEAGDTAKKRESELWNDHVERALYFLEQNYGRDISLSDMAAHACCSEYHFSRVFKKILGYSPYEYIVKYRVNRAKDLLKNTGRSVEEIADHVGFHSTSNFVRTFRTLEGMTPLKYRRYWNGTFSV